MDNRRLSNQSEMPSLADFSENFALDDEEDEPMSRWSDFSYQDDGKHAQDSQLTIGFPIPENAKPGRKLSSLMPDACCLIKEDILQKQRSRWENSPKANQQQSLERSLREGFGSKNRSYKNRITSSMVSYSNPMRHISIIDADSKVSSPVEPPPLPRRQTTLTLDEKVDHHNMYPIPGPPHLPMRQETLEKRQLQLN